MKIVHVIASLSGNMGGPSRTVPNLCSALSRNGQSVKLISWVARDSAPELAAARISHVDIRILEKGDSLDGHYDGCDLVHIHGCWRPQLHGAIVFAKKMSIPYIISPRGMLEPWALNQRKWRKQLAWWLYQRRDLMGAAALHATAESERANLAILGLISPVEVVPNGVLLTSGADVPTAKVAGGRRRLLFISRIHEKKGLGLLVEACGLLQNDLRRGGWEVVIAGPDDSGHWSQVQSQIDGLGIGHFFTYVGAVEGKEKNELFAGAHCFILPTFSENFGVVVAEALLAGLPVITTKGAPWSDLVKYECGWWVEANVPGVTQALLQMLSTDDVTLGAMGQRGRAMAEKNYNWDRIASLMVIAYRKCIKLPSASSRLFD